MSWSFNARGRRYTYTSVPAATVPASARFDVPARFQGQIITYAFAAAKPARDGAGVGDLWLRVHDANDRTTAYYRRSGSRRLPP